MELELNQEHISCFNTVINTSISQEETLEAIVPDACPDILRIVDTIGQMHLTEKSVQDGSVSLGGTVTAWIVYQPEGEQTICQMEVRLPFRARVDVPSLVAQGRCIALPTLSGIDARALNPRKVLIRADINTGIHALNPNEVVLCSGISSDELLGIQQLTNQHEVYLTAEVQEKAFGLSDELRLSAGPNGAAKLLGSHAQAWCNESKIIGNKLVFKGEVSLQVRYLVANELYCTRFPLSFSQIMEISNVGDGADCTVEVCFTDLDCTLSGDDHRTLNITAELLAQAIVRDPYQTTVLQDIYSTVYDLTAQQENFSFEHLLEHSVRPQNVREILETGVQVKSIMDCTLSVSDVTQSKEADQMVVGANLCLSILFLDEQDELQSLSRVISTTGRLDLPAHAQCQCRCICPGELYAAPTAGGIEVRFTLEFHCHITASFRMPGITAVRLGETKETQAAGRPSVVLRLAAPGETLWDIAKAYSTTQEQILQANQISADELPVGQMLLIPRTR